MTDRKPDTAEATADGEPFLERWSRKKARARAGMPEEEPADAAGSSAPAGAEAPQPGGGEAPAPVVLPDLDELDQDSDYSAFLAPGVDEALRRRALRKLFRSPKFNVLDGLDDYCEDFTAFESLGSIVTADMRLQAERAARAARKMLGKDGTDGPAAAVADDPKRPPADAGAGEPREPDMTQDPAEQHDEPDRPA